MMQPLQQQKQREYPTLYHLPRTISSPLVQILLELDNPGNVWIEEMNFTSIKSPEYLQNVNPMGTSPSFVDSIYNVNMFESGAIVDYVLEQYDRKNSLHPPVPVPVSATSSSPNLQGASLFQRLTISGKVSKPQEEYIAMTQKRAKYLQLKNYILATVYPFAATMFLHSLKPAEEQDAAYLQTSKEKWLNVIGPVLSNAIGDKSNSKGSNADIYFMGNTISAVDYLVSKPLTNIHQMDLLQCFPKLQTLFDHIRSRPTYKLAYETGRVAQLNQKLSTLSSSSMHSIEDDRCSVRSDQSSAQVQNQPTVQVASSMQPVKGFTFLANRKKRKQDKKQQQHQQQLSDESNSTKSKKKSASPPVQQQQGPAKVTTTTTNADVPTEDGVVLESTLIITYDDDDEMERSASVELVD